MEVLGIVLAIAGFLIALVGGIMFLMVAFEESVGWGLGCLFIPFVSLLFLIMYWDRAAKPFLINLVGVLPMLLGMALMGNGG